jgi:hypothetical protein
MKKVINFFKRLFGLTPQISKTVSTPKPQQKRRQKPKSNNVPKKTNYPFNDVELNVEVKEGVELTDAPKPKKKRYYRPKQKNGGTSNGNGKQTKNVQ